MKLAELIFYNKDWFGLDWIIHLQGGVKKSNPLPYFANF